MGVQDGAADGEKVGDGEGADVVGNKVGVTLGRIDGRYEEGADGARLGIAD